MDIVTIHIDHLPDNFTKKEFAELARHMEIFHNACIELDGVHVRRESQYFNLVHGNWEDERYRNKDYTARRIKRIAQKVLATLGYAMPLVTFAIKIIIGRRSKIRLK